MDESEWAKREECSRAHTKIVIYPMIICLVMGKLARDDAKKIKVFNELCKRL